MSRHLICLALTSISMLVAAPISYADDSTATTSKDQTAPATPTTPTTPTATAETTGESNGIKAEIADYNKKLPTMIDNITQLTHINLEGDNIIYNLKIISYNASELDAKKFEEKIRPSIMGGVCNDEKVMAMLKEGYSITYLYNGKDGTPISKILIAYSDCDAMNKNSVKPAAADTTSTDTSSSASATTPAPSDKE